jgi:ribosome biogenesis protein BMS1
VSINMTKQGAKAHRKKKAGSKALKRKSAEQKKQGTLEQSRESKALNNPRAFAFQSAKKAKASHARTAEREQRRLHGAWQLIPPSHCRVAIDQHSHNPAVTRRHHTSNGSAAPMLEQSGTEPPPFVVLVQGPPQACRLYGLD